MRMVMFAITLAAMGLGGWLYAMNSAPTTPRRAAVAHLRTIIPPETESEVRLDGCTLQVTVVAENYSGHVDVTDLSINLKLYNTEQIRISQMGTGNATYVAPRLGVNDAYLDQAMRLLAADGSGGFSNTRSLVTASGDLDPNALGDVLNKPNAQLVFGLSSSIKQREDGTSRDSRPSARAPDFDRFVDLVADLEPPATYLATRRYMNADRNGESLLTGSLRLPDHIEFAFPDKDTAHAFADALYSHHRADCP